MIISNPNLDCDPTHNWSQIEHAPAPLDAFSNMVFWQWLVSSRFDIVIGADLLYFGGWYVFVDVRVYARVSACLYAVARTVQTLYTQGYYEYGHSRSTDAVVSRRGLMLASTF